MLSFGADELLQTQVPQQRLDLGLAAAEGDPHVHVVLRAADLEDLGPEPIRRLLIEEAGLLEGGERIMVEHPRPDVPVVARLIPTGDVREIGGAVAGENLRDQPDLVEIGLLKPIDVDLGKRRTADAEGGEVGGADAGARSRAARAETLDSRTMRRSWAQVIKRTYEVDPLVWPSCGGEMNVIAFITEHEIVDAILRHLKRREERRERVPPS